MKLFVMLVFSVLFFACDGNRESALPAVQSTENTDTVGSLKLRNQERREIFLAEAEKRQLDIWINEDDSIGYHIADDEVVDDIFDWVRAVIWVNN